MIKKPSPKVARIRAGKSSTHHLAKLWLALGAPPHPTAAWESFIEALVEYMEGWRQSSERCANPAEAEDIRQEAAILLEQGYLVGNRSLAAATTTGNLAAIEKGILHAIRGAIKISRQRLQARGIHQKQIEDRLANYLQTIPTDANPSAVPDERRLITLAALQLALEHKRIDPRDAEIIWTRITKSITQTQLAKSSGVSRQAIHLREARAVKVLKRIVREMEGEALQ